MLRRGEDLLPARHLDDLAEIHDCDTVRHVLDDRQIVADEEQRETELLLQILQQVDDLRLESSATTVDRGDATPCLQRYSARTVRLPALPSADACIQLNRVAELGFALRLSHHPGIAHQVVHTGEMVCVLPPRHPLAGRSIISALDLVGSPSSD